MAQIRTAYSDGTGEGTVKGTADGKGATYGVRYSALLSGIVPPPLDAADKTRVVVCSLGVLPDGARFPELFADEDRLAEMGAQVRMRMFQLWPQLEASLKVVRAAICAKDQSPRFADTVGTLLAGWYVLMQGIAVDAEAAQQLLDLTNLDDHVAALEGASDERECADWLMGYQVQGAAYNVGELISMVAKGKEEHKRSLETLGLKVADGTLVVCSNKTLKGLRDLFQGSKFAAGGWATVLERVPGAGKSQPRFAGKKMYSVTVPLTWLFDEPADPVQGELL